ncbi:GNAT family N-acetyltransferase [Rossellomorea aquimaris]|uniref:GNAT family N-acetyltransferase n=1 Tax=Rossellomorea aquimaris TaxID=189382 RepID=UPI001CD20EF3|nr:GNAT family N-acetyltransferase [Rossellomorea aquimaris]MCA1056002.1 GNAT family N-acetyltransferase [Rossellomorea aquimaris]
MKIKQQWVQEDSDYIRQKLIEYNMSAIDDDVKTPLEKVSFVIRDDQDEIVGGVVGETFWHHLHIDFLWVSEEYRKEGYGVQLVERMEEFAKEKGCYLVILDTFSFQAPGFYKKLGYEEFGVLEDFPKGSRQHYMEKRLR